MHLVSFNTRVEQSSSKAIDVVSYFAFTAVLNSHPVLNNHAKHILSIGSGVPLTVATRLV